MFHELFILYFGCSYIYSRARRSKNLSGLSWFAQDGFLKDRYGEPERRGGGVNGSR
jgi:hypothetical protein